MCLCNLCVLTGIIHALCVARGRAYHDAVLTDMVDVNTDSQRAIIPTEDRVYGRTSKGIRVHWHWRFADLPTDAPVIIVAQEFFDALPVHQFKYTERGWCERMVDIDDEAGYGSYDEWSWITVETMLMCVYVHVLCVAFRPYHFRFVLAPRPTPSSVAFLAQVPVDAHKAPMQVTKGLDTVDSTSGSQGTGSTPGLQYFVRPVDQGAAAAVEPKHSPSQGVSLDAQTGAVLDGVDLSNVPISLANAGADLAVKVGEQIEVYVNR